MTHYTVVSINQGRHYRIKKIDPSGDTYSQKIYSDYCECCSDVLALQNIEQEYKRKSKEIMNRK